MIGTICRTRQEVFERLGVSHRTVIRHAFRVAEGLAKDADTALCSARGVQFVRWGHQITVARRAAGYRVWLREEGAPVAAGGGSRGGAT